MFSLASKSAIWRGMPQIHQQIVSNPYKTLENNNVEQGYKHEPCHPDIYKGMKGAKENLLYGTLLRKLLA